MAFTAADRDAIKAALALGALTVRHADGQMVTYRSVQEMRETLAMIEAELGAGGEANPARLRRGFAVFRA